MAICDIFSRLARASAQTEINSPACSPTIEAPTRPSARDHHLDQPGGFGERKRAVVVGKIEPRNFKSVTVYIAGLSFGQANLGKLGVGKCYPGDVVAPNFGPASQTTQNGSPRPRDTRPHA